MELETGICKSLRQKKKLGADERTLGDRGGDDWKTVMVKGLGEEKGTFEKDKNWFKRQEEN